MEIHRFEAVWTVVSLLLVVGWIATVTYGAVGPPAIHMVDASGGIITNPTQPASSPNFRAPGVYQTGPDQYAVYVVAAQFFWTPGSAQPIRVPAGSTVTFYLTSRDVIHGFEVVGTNVNSMVIPGEVAKLTVHFDQPREYGILCNEYCGAGHHSMEGRLVVVPADQFTGGQSA